MKLEQVDREGIDRDEAKSSHSPGLRESGAGRNSDRFLTGLSFFILKWVGRLPSQVARVYAYRQLGMRIGRLSAIYGGAEVRSPHKIVIGDHTIIGSDAVLDGRGHLIIGSNVNFSSGVWIWTAEHDCQDPHFGYREGKVIVEDYVWISSRTTILPNVTVGRGAVICAGAVVTKSVDPYSVVAGVPAQVIGERTRDLRYDLSSKEALPFV